MQERIIGLAVRYLRKHPNRATKIYPMAAVQKFGITAKKSDGFSEWYQQVVVRSELLDYYDVRGCFIMRPSAMFIWGEIRRFFDHEIAKMGVKECYFPMLVTKKNLELEKDHLSNFNPELAWITRCGDKDLEEPVALRPTSETIMYPAYAKWLNTYRDLPLKLNQWCSVLRWEVKSTLPFIRGREFLWQEGHTAFFDKAEAEKETTEILDTYKRIYKDLLAVPVIPGRKTRKETFGGAEYTLSIEAFIPMTGKGVQAATSHHLGQNFARIFDVRVETPTGGDERQLVYQNSWGCTTRSLGIAVMVHSDDLGFVCPPRVAEIQVVLMVCGVKASTPDEDQQRIRAYAEKVCDALQGHVRVHFDERDNVSPGFKFNHWELRGVPLRIEVGFRDLASGTVCAVRRDNRKKEQVPAADVVSGVCAIMDAMHEEMYEKARADAEAKTKIADSFDGVREAIDSLCQVMAPWCGDEKCEDEIAERTTVRQDGTVVSQGAKSLCIPFEAPDHTGKQCVICGGAAKSYTLFGRSY